MNEYKNEKIVQSSEEKESQILSQFPTSQVEFPAFQEALVAYYGHLMSQVQQNLIQLEFLRVLQTPSQQQQISKFYFFIHFYSRYFGALPFGHLISHLFSFFMNKSIEYFM